MDTFLKATAGILVATVLYLVLSKQSKDLSALLSVAVCCIVATAAMRYLQPIIQFFKKLQQIGELNPEMLGILLKSVGIAMLGEITTQICADSGNAALGKSLQILASAVILWLSVPLFTSLIELVEKILGSI